MMTSRAVLEVSVFRDMTFSFAVANAWGDEGGDAFTGDRGGTSKHFFTGI
jgi:hypothetical protein